MAMLPETTKDKATSAASLLNNDAHERKRERIHRELELAKEETRRALTETRKLLARAEQILAKR
jgi:hypothetical protein